MENIDLDNSGDLSFTEFCFSLYKDKGSGEIKTGKVKILKFTKLQSKIEIVKNENGGRFLKSNFSYQIKHFDQ